MTGGSTNCPQELRERAVRLVSESRPNYDTEWAAMTAVANKLGIGSTETLRKRVDAPRSMPVSVRVRRRVRGTEATASREPRAEAGQ